MAAGTIIILLVMWCTYKLTIMELSKLAFRIDNSLKAIVAFLKFFTLKKETWHCFVIRKIGI